MGTELQQASVSCNKYSAEFKTKVAADAIRLGPAKAGRHWSVPQSTVGDWKKKYVTQASLAIESDNELQADLEEVAEDCAPVSRTKINTGSGNCNRYSAEFKAKVASDAMRLGPVEAGRRWSVPKSTVADWKRIYMKH